MSGEPIQVKKIVPEEVVQKEYQIQNNDLKKEIERAEKSQGYFITVSRLGGDTLYHRYFTRKFNKADLMSSLDEIGTLIEPELIKE